jgi:hypothetical protein
VAKEPYKRALSTWTPFVDTASTSLMTISLISFVTIYKPSLSLCTSRQQILWCISGKNPSSHQDTALQCGIQLQSKGLISKNDSFGHSSSPQK